MNSQDYRNLQEAYLDVYEQEEVLDEISQKTATRAFAQRATNEFETDQTSKKSDATKSRIEKKFGKKAGAHAERAAHANIFGRKSSSMPKESYDLYDIILSHLIAEGYADTKEAAERIMVNMSEEWKETILEITGGKGHPGYKAGSRDLGPMQSGHPADSSKRTMKGGTMSMRHGDHLGDLDDDDDDDDDDGLEAGLKDSARKSRENVRKPLRNMVKTAAKRLNK